LRRSIQGSVLYSAIITRNSLASLQAYSFNQPDEKVNKALILKILKPLKIIEVQIALN